jgi:hypothetical protein
MKHFREIHFWQTKMNRGLLITTTQMHRDRAIRFFGAEAVFSKDEPNLIRILEAYTIAFSSDKDLLVEMNQPHIEVLEKLNLPPKQLQIIRKKILLKRNDIVAFKKAAKMRLLCATGAARLNSLNP